MKRDKYVGMDVHQSMTVVAVMNAEGKIVLETMVPTAASRIRELIESLGGPLHVTLEEGPQFGDFTRCRFPLHVPARCFFPASRNSLLHR